jgi:hypothetical protein
MKKNKNARPRRKGEWAMRLALTLALSPRERETKQPRSKQSLDRGPCPAQEKLPPLLGERAGVRESADGPRHPPPPQIRGGEGETQAAQKVRWVPGQTAQPPVCQMNR